MRTWITTAAALLLALTVGACTGRPDAAEPGAPPDPAAHTDAQQDTADGDGAPASSDDGDRPDDGAGTPGDDAADDGVVRIGLTDWSIETGDAQIGPGQVTLVVTNAGGTAHDLLIHGTHGTWGTPYLAPGEVHEVQITAEAGETLELECTVAGHRSAGMYTQVQVSDAGGTR